VLLIGLPQPVHAVIVLRVAHGGVAVIGFLSGEASGTLLAVSGSWWLEQCHSAWKSKRTGSVSRGFPSGSKTPLYHIDTGGITRAASWRYGFGRRAWLQFIWSSNAL
jgi:hypothetical protein